MPFLTARWLDLAMLNWEVPADALARLVPRGTELDGWQGRTFLSLVGFRFAGTRVLRLPVPGHVNFEEVNLRLYVRRECPGEVRRGVVFVKEIVPRACIALVARRLYNENYVAAPMSHRIERRDDGLRVRYDWTMQGRTHAMAVDSDGAFREMPAGSLEEFITEHYWGYCTQRDGTTLEYRVAHPRWQVAGVHSAKFEGDAEAVYGRELGRFLGGPPTSAFLADGSKIEVHFGERF